MLQLKTSPEGVSVTLNNGATLWMSPQRDLVSVFDFYAARALHIVKSNPANPVVKRYFDAGGSLEEVERFGLVLHSFSACPCDPRNHALSVFDAFDRAGIEQQSQRVRTLFSELFTLVVLSAYFAGMKEAIGGSYKPHMFCEVIGALAPHVAWYKKPLYWLYRQIGKAL